MRLVRQEHAHGAEAAVRTLADALEAYRRRSGPDLDRAWSVVAEVEALRRLAAAIEREASHGRASAADVELAALAEAVVDAVVDHAQAARLHRELGDAVDADAHALEALRRADATLARVVGLGRGDAGEAP